MITFCKLFMTSIDINFCSSNLSKKIFIIYKYDMIFLLLLLFILSSIFLIINLSIFISLHSHSLKAILAIIIHKYLIWFSSLDFSMISYMSSLALFLKRKGKFIQLLFSIRIFLYNMLLNSFILTSYLFPDSFIITNNCDNKFVG